MPHPIPHLHEILAREAAIGSAVYGGYTPVQFGYVPDQAAIQREARVEQHKDILYIKKP